jgi:enterochelin esterase-like enzyme
MIKLLQLIFIVAIFPLSVLSQNGKVYDLLSQSSKILDTERNFAIYLPPGYGSSNRSYPVLYLLHGGGGNQTDWIQQGDVAIIADKAINSGQATSMIIAMPDAGNSDSGYQNDIRGIWDYEDYFFKEFIPYIESNYRIKKEKRFRAIAGLSMGGEASFAYANLHPELFSSACMLSTSFEVQTYEGLQTNLRKIAGEEVLSEEDIKEVYEKYYVFHILETKTREELESVRWYIDCGDDDFLYEGNSLVHIALRKKEVQHEFRIRDGGHTWKYWRESLPEVLKFVSETFR